MFVEVIEEKRNPLLERREVLARVSEYETTPSRDAIIEELAKKLNASKESVYIAKVEQHFGQKKALVQAQVYASAQALDKHVHKKLLHTSGKKAKQEEEKAKATGSSE